MRRSEVYAGSAGLFTVFHCLGKILVSVTIVLFPFGLVVAVKNRFKILENTRRPFLYLNVPSFYGKANLLGVLFPKEYVWCDADGSIALNPREAATVMYVLGAAFREASIIATPFALIWVCFVWRKTIKNWPTSERQH